jgi:hypothetical protein
MKERWESEKIRNLFSETLKIYVLQADQSGPKGITHELYRRLQS